MAARVFSQSQIDAIAKALGDTSEGLTGSEIAHLLSVCRMEDPGPLTKWIRLQNAFVSSQNDRKDRRAILAFIRHSMKPERHLNNRDRFETLRSNLNVALLFCGLQVEEDGSLASVDAARTISDAESRAKELRADLDRRDVHPDVLRFCKAELVADNYFHAVLEAVKSVADKMRKKTGLDSDGDELVSRALSGNPPMIAINELSTKSQRSEQSGFANLVRGIFGMFRNPTAHEARIRWDMTKQDAEDLLTLLSLVHRRLDSSRMPPRV